MMVINEYSSNWGAVNKGPKPGILSTGERGLIVRTHNDDGRIREVWIGNAEPRNHGQFWQEGDECGGCFGDDKDCQHCRGHWAEEAEVIGTVPEYMKLRGLTDEADG